MKYPQSPEQWDDANYTLYRSFKFRSTPDIEILQRLVRENISDRGNSRYTRAKLLGILNSIFSDANKRFWLKHYHPKTWWYRYQLQKMRQWYHRVLKTKKFKTQVMLCNAARDVVKRMELIDKENGLQKRK